MLGLNLEFGLKDMTLVATEFIVIKQKLNENKHKSNVFGHTCIAYQGKSIKYMYIYKDETHFVTHQ